MSNHVGVAAKVEDKAILACQRHIARTVALGGTHEKEVEGMAFLTSRFLEGFDHR